MACSNTCFGHDIRIARDNKIMKATKSPPRNLEEDKVVLIKMGPTSKGTSLKGLAETYANKPGWKVIDNGGVLSVPVEEFRMINTPKPDREGNVQFGKRKGKGAANLIESYPVGQTVADLNEQTSLLSLYSVERALCHLIHNHCFQTLFSDPTSFCISCLLLLQFWHSDTS